MHDIEPHYQWRDRYIASEDDRSPFYGRVYNEFQFTQKIYNYFIHPQWDHFGSQTLYIKILFVDYDERYAIIEMIGEWNDCLQNDIMFLKRNIADQLIDQGIDKFILLCENVLNFHGSDDCYYEEWYEDVLEYGGWVCCLNLLEHVQTEMQDTQIQHFFNIGGQFNDVIWRPHKPKVLFHVVENLIKSGVKQLRY